MLQELWEGGTSKQCFRVDLSEAPMNTRQTKQLKTLKSNYL
jgi:hypothetical protein